MFSSFILMLDICTSDKVYASSRIIKLCRILPVVAGTFLVFSYYFLGNTARIAHCITLGFANPNFTGMWLLHLIIYGSLFVLKWHKQKWSLLHIPIIAIMILLLFETGARSCFFAIVFWMGLLLLRAFHIRINRFMCMCIALIPIVFSIIYLNVIELGWVKETFSYMVSEGKPLTSRVSIWKSAYDSFGGSPIVGDYAGISHGTGQSQLHNTHVDVLCSYGLLPFCLYINTLYVSLKRTLTVANSFYQYAAFAGFCAIIVIGSFEAAIVSGAMGMNLLSVGLLVLAYREDKSTGGEIMSFQRERTHIR